MPRVYGKLPGAGSSARRSSTEYTAFSGSPESLWIPSEPSVTLDQFGEHATQALRVQERDADAVHPHPWFGIDQLSARRLRLGERLLDVGDRESDVVQTRPALGEKLADRRVLAERAHQLDLAR